MEQIKYDKDAPLPVSPSHSATLTVDEQLVWAEVMRRIMSGKVESIGGILGVNTASSSLISSDSSLRVLSPDTRVRKAVKSMVAKGLLFKLKKKNKRTALCCVSVLNMFLMEKLGMEYFKYLEPHSSKVAEGNIVNRGMIDWSLRSSESFAGAQVYPQIYSKMDTAFNNSDIESLLVRIYSYGSKEPSSVPMNISGILVLNNIYGMGERLDEEEKRYGLYLAIAAAEPDKLDDLLSRCMMGVEFAKVPVKDDTPKIEEALAPETSVPPQADPQEPPPSSRASASMDYKEYCKYLQVGDSLKKKTEDWSAKDFVVYVYCGLAKWSQPPFPLPEFARECAQIKRIMTAMGNQHLRDIILFFVKNYEDIRKSWSTRDFTISVTTLCTPWKLEKLARMEDDARRAGVQNDEIRKFKENEQKAAERFIQQHNTQVGDLVNEMREKFNNKENEDGKKETFLAGNPE